MRSFRIQGFVTVVLWCDGGVLKIHTKKLCNIDMNIIVIENENHPCSCTLCTGTAVCTSQTAGEKRHFQFEYYKNVFWPDNWERQTCRAGTHSRVKLQCCSWEIPGQDQSYSTVGSQIFAKYSTLISHARVFLIFQQLTDGIFWDATIGQTVR